MEHVLYKLYAQRFFLSSSTTTGEVPLGRHRVEGMSWSLVLEELVGRKFHNYANLFNWRGWDFRNLWLNRMLLADGTRGYSLQNESCMEKVEVKLVF